MSFYFILPYFILFHLSYFLPSVLLRRGDQQVLHRAAPRGPPRRPAARVLRRTVRALSSLWHSVIPLHAVSHPLRTLSPARVSTLTWCAAARAACVICALWKTRGGCLCRPLKPPHRRLHVRAAFHDDFAVGVVRRRCVCPNFAQDCGLWNINYPGVSRRPEIPHCRQLWDIN